MVDVMEIPGNERWLKDSVGRYSVSEEGQVFSYMRGKREVKGALFTRRDGRKTRNICLRINKKQTTKYVAHLVAEAFVPIPSHFTSAVFLRYKDLDSTNCRADNLYWMSAKEMTALHSERLIESNTKRPTLDELDYAMRGVGQPISENRWESFKRYIKPEQLVAAGIPPEYLDFDTKECSYFKSWQRNKALFENIDDGLSLSQCAEKSGLHFTMVSLVRNGHRLAAQRAAYDKWKAEKPS